jgi:hypothetical protein
MVSIVISYLRIPEVIFNVTIKDRSEKDDCSLTIYIHIDFHRILCRQHHRASALFCRPSTKLSLGVCSYFSVLWSLYHSNLGHALLPHLGK